MSHLPMENGCFQRIWIIGNT